jgi:2-C-methyl-D-erythritol 4-phosphate cytidylyltransferase/2-C-methyl-D-erythritol 2,4-cyclodiphosphate synthase
MKQKLAAILGVAPDRVAIKATTSEKMGFTGRREGLCAFATCLVKLPAAHG